MVSARLGTRRFTEVHGATVNILHRPDSLPSREDCQLPAQLADLLPSPTKKPPTLQTRPLLRVIRDSPPRAPIHMYVVGVPFRNHSNAYLLSCSTNPRRGLQYAKVHADAPSNAAAARVSWVPLVSS